jgi:hypothetical protein
LQSSARMSTRISYLLLSAPAGEENFQSHETLPHRTAPPLLPSPVSPFNFGLNVNSVVGAAPASSAAYPCTIGRTRIVGALPEWDIGRGTRARHSQSRLAEAKPIRIVANVYVVTDGARAGPYAAPVPGAIDCQPSLIERRIPFSKTLP